MAKKPEKAKPSLRGGKSGELSSFQDLNPADFPETNSVIDLDVDLMEISISITDDSEEVKKIEDSAAGIRAWLETHLPKLDELYAAPKAVRIRSENTSAVKRIKDKIHGFMNHPEAAYRQAAWVAFLIHKIKSATGNYLETIEWLSKMVSDGYLEEGDYRAPLQAWKYYFRVPEVACFTRPEFEEVKVAMKELVGRVNQATAQQRQGRVSELQKEANLQPAETFVKGNEGKSFIFVPPQISDKNGKIEIRKAGYLLVEVTQDERIYPLEGVGSFEERVAEANQKRIFVKGFTLAWDFPPSKKKLVEAGFSEEQASDFFFCWYLLKRAKSLLEQGNQHLEEKIELSKEVSISEEGFFLDGQDGYVLVDFEGVWETWTPDKDDQSGKRQKKQEIYSLFLLVKREEGMISIVSCPDHLKGFFSACMATYTEGQKFLGVPEPLRSILQAQYGATQTRSLLNS
ncbi:MAG: hypothetical protein A2904_00400 [Candidatus Staskawiczbacteria bacterium RIFCSPLOWO2_01_FULL_33_9]|uniref:Uncharacterized protein n=1 Tax=Candidatus Staskawiczbacteria bacterium RIFCSPLOWO2_01_FULL_33_9 TaxID=1802211 RepID=A0A1G2I5Q4_9BACT|nr:MAG: hypothetical protein A2904_00400 [Candidatus Staskawiczbacteria bacterium RIFCSPLOWO2_01_FULL_33_9]